MEWIPLAAVGALVAFLLVVRWPIQASLGIYALLLPFDSVLTPAQAGGIHLHLTWFVGLAAVGILFSIAILGKRFVRPPQAAVWLALLVFWAAMTSLWAINRDHSVFRLPVLALLLSLYLISASVRLVDEELRTITWLAIIGGCIAAGVCLYGFTHGQWWRSPNVTDFYDQLSGRGTVSFEDRVTNPNTLGATLILPLSLGLGQLVCTSGRKLKFLVMGFVTLIGAGICATMSRQALVAGVVVCLVYFRRSPVTRRISVTMAALGATAAVAMPHLFFARLGQSFTDRGQGRLDIWLVGLQAFKNYALSGVGLDCFTDVYNKFIGTGVNFVGFSRAPHNIYLGVGVELGIIGIVLLAGMIVAHLRFSPCRSAARDDSSRLQLLPFKAALIGLLVSGLFLDLLWEQYFWFTLMLLVMAVRVNERKLSQEQTYLHDHRTGVLVASSY